MLLLQRWSSIEPDLHKDMCFFYLAMSKQVYSTCEKILIRKKEGEPEPEKQISQVMFEKNTLVDRLRRSILSKS